MVIDKRGMALFVSMALAASNTCDAFTSGNGMRQKGLVLRAFASDKGQSTSQYEHFSISDDASSPNLAPPPMARPSENSKLARVGATAPPGAAEEEAEPAAPKLSVWERQKAAEIQGGSLRTWSFAHQHKLDMIQVHMKTDGRPMNANGA